MNEAKSRFKRTSKELKRGKAGREAAIEIGFKRTSKELKLTSWEAQTGEKLNVLSVPIRN